MSGPASGHYVSHETAVKMGEHLGCERCGLAMEFWDASPECEEREPEAQPFEEGRAF